MQAALKKVFGGLNITWPIVIIGAVVAGIYTGVLTMIPGIQDTSLTSICVTFEAWVLFAAIITTNVKTPLESALKCFVFFLISQPLVFLVQVPASGWAIMDYYIHWIPWTIATLPLGFAGYYINKNTIVSVIVMAAGSLFLAFHAGNFLSRFLANPPSYILSFLFTTGLIFALIIGCFDAGKLRKVSLGIAIAVLAVSFFFVFNPTVDVTYGLTSFDDEIEVTADCEIASSNESVCTTEIIQISEENYTASIHWTGFGTTEITFTDADGTVHRYTATLQQGEDGTYDISVDPL